MLRKTGYHDSLIFRSENFRENNAQELKLLYRAQLAPVEIGLLREQTALVVLSGRGRDEDISRLELEHNDPQDPDLRRDCSDHDHDKSSMIIAMTDHDARRHDDSHDLLRCCLEISCARVCHASSYR